MAITKKPPTQRALNALETKNTLFTTALQLFAEYGFENVTVDEITSRAGVSKGTFYTHFETKESVLVEQFHKIDQHYDEVFATVPAEAPAGERLLILIGAMTHYCADICGVEVLRVVYASQASSSHTMPILNNKDRRLYAHLREIVALGKSAGDFHTDLPDEELVELLMRSARGLIFDWCLYGPQMDLTAEGQRYYRIILSCLGAPEGQG